MSAALRLIQGCADHSGGAAQALNLIAEARKHALKLVPLPCERCLRTECGRESASRTYHAALTGDADEPTCEALFVQVVLTDDACVPVESMEFRPARVIPEHDIELDEHGFCASYNPDERYDMARERSKERT